MLAAAERAFGQVDILVTNGGGPPAGPFESHAPDAWDAAVRANLTSVVELVRGVLPGMKAHLTLPVTHTFMMLNPVVIAQTIRFLETGRFDPELGLTEAVGTALGGP